MSNNTTLNPGVGGDVIVDEDIGGGVKMPVSKIRLGAAGVDGGDVTVTNPFPAALSDGTQTIGVAAHPVRTDPTGTTIQPVSGTVTDNQGAPNTLANAWPVELSDGTNLLGVSAHPVRIDPTGTTAQPISAASLPALSGTTAVSLASLPAVSGTVTSNQGTPNTLANKWPVQVSDGTNTMPTGDAAARALFHKVTDGTNTATVKPSATAPLGTDTALVVSINPVGRTVSIVGNAGGVFDGAIGAAVPGGALQVGLRAATANPANATAGNAVSAMADKAGRAVVTPVQVRDLVAVQQTNVAATTETTVVAAGGAGVFNDLIGIVISTAGSAAGTITIKDATAGTTRFVLNYPDAALAPAGGPLVMMFPVPIPQAVANNNWTVTQSLVTACNYTFLFAKNT